MIVTNQYLIQFLYHASYWQIPHVPYHSIDFFTLLCKLLLVGFPLHPVPSCLAVGRVLRESRTINQ